MAVTGIGGVFLRSDDPEALSAWYLEHLGVGGEWGQWAQQAGPTVFSPFTRDSDYFPLDRQVMLNFRVDALDDLIASLTASGIEVITRPEWNDPAIGRFARVHDCDGNPIELWEPVAD